MVEGGKKRAFVTLGSLVWSETGRKRQEWACVNQVCSYFIEVTKKIVLNLLCFLWLLLLLLL